MPFFFQKAFYHTRLIYGLTLSPIGLTIATFPLAFKGGKEVEDDAEEKRVMSHETPVTTDWRLPVDSTYVFILDMNGQRIQAMMKCGNINRGVTISVFYVTWSLNHFHFQLYSPSYSTF